MVYKMDNCIGFGLPMYFHGTILGMTKCAPVELFGAESDCKDPNHPVIYCKTSMKSFAVKLKECGDKK